MKQLIQWIVIPIIIGILCLFVSNQLSQTESVDGKVLYVYNWGEYIDHELIDQFEEEYGYKVILETFDSNEAMLAKVKNGGTHYDVAVPSEYMIEMMKEEDLLIPIDYKQIPNIKHIEDEFLDLSFDRNNKYSVPYFWGTVGILYHPERTKGIDFSSWESLYDERLKNEVLLVDGPRESLGFALNLNGYSLNSKEDQQLEKAYDSLLHLTPNIRGIVGDEINTMMTQNEAKAAVVWSGMARDIMWENEALDYIVPEEGSNLWFDNFVIPKTAQNTKGAHEFINFLLDPEISAQNTEWVGYATPNEAAKALLGKEVSEDERFYPSDQMKEKLEVYENLGEAYTNKYSELYLKFKINLN